MTVSPGPVRWQKELAMHWRRVRYFARAPFLRILMRWPFRLLLPRGPAKLVELSMIGFARWSLFDRIPTGVPKDQARKLRRPFLLFETNYNGDRDMYFESFSYVVPHMMNRVWARAYGVPDARWVSAFLRHINRMKSPVDYYYAAYPNGSTKMIRSALELSRMIASFRSHLPDQETFAPELMRLQAQVQRIRNPRLPAPRKTGSLTTLAPMAPGRWADVKDALSCLEDPPQAVPDATTHFARWCMLDELRMPKEFKADPTSYLLFSAWFDGEEDAWVRALYESLGPDRVGRIWGLAGDAGPTPDAFAEHVSRYRLEPHSFFHGYDGVSVREVRDALRVANAFSEFVATSQSQPGDALRTNWLEHPVLGPSA